MRCFPSLAVEWRWQWRKVRYVIVSVIILFIVLIFVLYTDLFGRNKFWEYNPVVSDVRKAVVYEKTIEELRRRVRDGEQKSEFYRKRPETQHIDCARVMNGDQEYISTINGNNRVFLVEDPALNMSCTEVIRRINPFPEKLKPLKSGIAFARIVYRDYEFIEKQIHTSFHPQNYFCFAVDKKSDPIFQQKILQMARCFDNMQVLPITEEYDSKGHNYNLANAKCMEQMLKFTNWNYIFHLQNDDVITKTVYEMERVYELLGGANDVRSIKEQGRVNYNFKWDPKSLKLFRNESGISEQLLNTSMKFAKSPSQVSVSRAAADWLINTVNLDIFIDQWNRSGYASDEQFLGSFQVNSEYGMPGHFTDECIKQGIETEHVSRMTQWTASEYWKCASKTIRHSICLMGIEDLRTVAGYPNLMFNKMIPSFDYSIVECTAELLFNRTFLGQNDHPLDEEFYSSMVHVLYHKHHKEPGYRLNCTPSVRPWKKMKYPL